MEIVYYISGVLTGVVVVYFFFRTKLSSVNTISEDKIRSLQDENSEVRQKNEIRERELLELTKDNSFRMAENDALKEKLSENRDEIIKLNERLKLEFQNLANKILEEKTKTFTEQNKQNLDQLLKPLSEKIKDFEKKVEETYDKEAQQRFSLKEEVKKLAELNQKVSEEAKNLTLALKGDSKTQGNWGEMILESILEKSGLEKGREYHVQPTFRDESGTMLRPDVIVEYPGERYVIIDSKVSLTDYERYTSAEDEKERKKYLIRHIQSVKNHIAGLSRKNYQEIYDVKSLDFIMLFVPVEPAYLAAIHYDSELWSYAYDKRILIISPTNLIAALKMISSLWRQEYQNRNAKEIARQSEAMLDKFYNLLSDLTDLGNKLDSTRKVYDNTIRKLSEGKGNLIKRVKDIEKLGVKASKKMPDNYRNSLEEED